MGLPPALTHKRPPRFKPRGAGLCAAALLVTYPLGSGAFSLWQETSGSNPVHRAESPVDIGLSSLDGHQSRSEQLVATTLDGTSYQVERGQPLAPSVTTRERIIAHVRLVFGPRAEEALRVADCESALIHRVDGYDPYAINVNRNGTRDYSVFQINSVHAQRFGTAYQHDWEANVAVAHALFLAQGWQPWYSTNRCHRLLATE